MGYVFCYPGLPRVCENSISEAYRLKETAAKKLSLYEGHGFSFLKGTGFSPYVNYPT
jgi:hypothetical protein